MIFLVIFLLCIGAIAAWWLSRQRLTSKPWLEQGVIDEPAMDLPTRPSSTALGVLIAVISSLFAFLFSAYAMRRGLGDWRPFPTPTLLWINTAVLAASCAALQTASNSARRGDRDVVRSLLLGAGALAAAFLAGQLIVWRELAAAGYLVASDPANSFFYLVTGVHGLHLVGGLVALALTIARVWNAPALGEAEESIRLCAAYWHFLLLVWILFLMILTGWADEFVVLCRSVVGA